MPTALQATPVRRIIAAIADAAAPWCDSHFPPRVRALERVAARTGYSIPVVEYAFDRLFGSITAAALESTIARELGERPVVPVGRVAVISSRTTIGVAVVPALFALCAKCDVVVKDREDALVATFFESLSQQLDTLAVAARAQAWSGTADAHDLGAYDAVVAFGGNDALAAIRAQLAPCARFIAFGPKASIGYVTREALNDQAAAREIASGAARDLLLYDGEGCLSLHALFVESGGGVSPQGFATLLASAVEGAAIEFPLGTRDPASAARVANARDLAFFRASGPVYCDPEASYVLEMGSAQRPPAFLPRVLALGIVNSPDEMAEYVAQHHLPLEACAVATARDDVIAAAVGAGANRIAHFGELQAPSIADPHGGRPRIAEFVRLVAQRS